MLHVADTLAHSLEYSEYIRTTKKNNQTMQIDASQI